MPASPKSRPRILVGKVGLDGHTTGVYEVSKGLSDAGFEVVFGGIRLTPAQLAGMALQEDADIVGVSVLSGAHLTVARGLIDALAARDLSNLPVVLGGIVPPEDIPKLKAMGVRDVFTPGTLMPEIAERIRRILQPSRA